MRACAILVLGIGSVAVGQTAEFFDLGDMVPTAISGDGSSVYGDGPWLHAQRVRTGPWVWRGSGPIDTLYFPGRRVDEGGATIAYASSDGSLLAGHRPTDDDGVFHNGAAPFTLADGVLTYLPVSITNYDAVIFGGDSTGRLLCGAALVAPVNPAMVDRSTDYGRQLPVLWRDGVPESPETGPDGLGGAVFGVSDDARVLVGVSWSYLLDGSISASYTTMWIDGERVIIDPPIGQVPPGYTKGALLDVSRNGRIAVGGFYGSGFSNRDKWALFALIDGCIHLFPPGPFANSYSKRVLHKISDNGAVVVGFDETYDRNYDTYEAAMIWRLDRGFPEPFPVLRLTRAHDLTSEFEFYFEALVVNSDGTVVAGRGDGGFVLRLPPRCLADISGSPSDPDVWDGQTNLTDLLRFVDLYSSNDPRADIAGNTQSGDPRDGVVDTTDLDTYLDRWQRGVGQCLDYP